MGAQFLFGHKDGYYVYVTDVAKATLMSPMNINDCIQYTINKI